MRIDPLGRRNPQCPWFLLLAQALSSPPRSLVCFPFPFCALSDLSQTDKLDPPPRQLDSPLRVPVSNVFKGLTAGTSGVGASGRVVSGIVQIGDRIQIVPGDETGIVRCE